MKSYEQLKVALHQFYTESSLFVGRSSTRPVKTVCGSGVSFLQSEKITPMLSSGLLQNLVCEVQKMCERCY